MNTAKCAAFWLALALALPATAPQARETAGTVKAVKGDVSIVRSGATLKASSGMKVMPEDKIVTGEKSSLGVTLQDDTLLAFGPKSVCELSRFRFDPVRRDGNLLISILEGSMRFVTGQLGKLRPESVEIHAPEAVVGIRGTDFIVSVERGK